MATSGSLKKQAMAGWYDPLLLLQTAVRVAISTVFGQFADKREAIAASNAVEPQTFDASFDFSKVEGDLWLDFLADTGDGWNPTYAMARLLTDLGIKPEGTEEELPRGRLLLLGGDQVYPTASREEYDNRFLYPFDTAAAGKLGPKRLLDPPQDIFALPGNHDWYDGLSGFFNLFCRRRLDSKATLSVARPGRIIAGRKTSQTRSYFAVRLTNDWWVWGTDSQLEGYIDQPQVDFFRHVADHWMAKKSKLILCVGQPSWAYADPKKPEANFSSFSYLERLAEVAVDQAGKPMGHQLKLVLTGDSHHYSRFTEDDRTYITCGGGGAFLHPTHHLKDRKFAWRYPRPGQKIVAGQSQYTRDFRIARKPDGSEALYPDRRTSSQLTYRNIGFAFKNPWFTALLVVAYGLFLWVLDATAHATLGLSLPEKLQAGSLLDSVREYWGLIVAAPGAAVLIVIALIGYIYFADADGKSSRIAKGATHAALQAVFVTLTSCAIMRIEVLQDPWHGIPIILAAMLSAVVSATVFGVYLIVNLQGWGRHWNEAFSAFAHEGFKSMLRMRIRSDGWLEIFPIGLRHVPKDDGQKPSNPDLNPALIEPPVMIR